MPKGTPMDLTGKRFGKWTVLGRADTDRHGNIRWRCRCECGTERNSFGGVLRSGASRQCMKCRRTALGMRHTRLYNIWAGMVARCHGKWATCYRYYGGRGIAVCDEWRESKVFLRWALNNGYGKELTIDRIDNDGNYEPSNCRWATCLQQARNKSDTFVITANSVAKPLTVWAEIVHIHPATIRSRLGRGWTPGQALSLDYREPHDRRQYEVRVWRSPHQMATGP